ncbi:MAG: DNA repair exonuclease [Spirochaetes bacterium]|nr:DNA repair exonuclease [Spirochaetota bacterium]
MSLRIFHTADVHLGMKFSSYPGVRQELVEARFVALERCVTLANENECDLFVIAGDLFDRISVFEKDIIRAAKIVSEFQGAFACTLPGNHDHHPSGSRNIWELFSQHAGDRHKVLTEQAVYPLAGYDLDANLYPAPCSGKHSDHHVLGWICGLKRDTGVRHHIGIAHGSLEGFSPDFDKKYYPVSEKVLRSCGMDLWLLGHTHTRYPEKPGAHDTIFFPGTPQPDGFDCTHTGHAWILHLDDENKIHAESLSTGSIRFIHDEVTLNTPADMESLLKRYSADEYGRTLLKLTLGGVLSREDYASISPLLEEMKKRLFFLHEPVDMSNLTEKIAKKEIDEEFTEGSFPHMLLTALVKEEDTLALQLAYELIKEARR